MSQPPPKKLPEELKQAGSLGLQNYHKQLTDGLYFLWSELGAFTKAQIQNALGVTTGLYKVTGFIPSSAASPDTDVTYAVSDRLGESHVITDGVKYSTSSNLTKQIDATFAAGTDQGGLGDSVSFSAYDTVYVFAIYETATPANVDVYFDDDSSGANPPTGWTVLGLVDIRQIDGDGDLYATVGYDRGLFVDNVFNQMPVYWNAAPTNTNAVLVTIESIPPSTEGTLGWGIRDTSATVGVTLLCTNTNQDDVAPDGNLHTLRTPDIDTSGNATNNTEKVMVPDASQQVRFRASATSGITVKVFAVSHRVYRE